MPDVRIPLQPTHYYHIYNHAVGDENFFERDIDYYYFIVKMEKYLLPVTELLAYCLQPNHFHFVVRIKTKEEITEYLKTRMKPARFSRLHTREYFIEDQLSRIYSNLFNAYAKRYNLIYGRMGTLFKRAFMRKAIESTGYLHNVISYVHLNPVHHCHVASPEEWKYSSFDAIIKNRRSIVDPKEVLELFGGLDNFLFCHQQPDRLPPT